jgi:hypothetical protein
MGRNDKDGNLHISPGKARKVMQRRIEWLERRMLTDKLVGKPHSRYLEEIAAIDMCLAALDVVHPALVETGSTASP